MKKNLLLAALAFVGFGAVAQEERHNYKELYLIHITNHTRQNSLAYSVCC